VTSSAEPWAKSVPCASCGAPLPVRLAGDHVRCAFCGVDTPVPTEILAEATEQLQRLKEAHESERRELEDARSARLSADNTRWAVIWVVTFAVLCVAWVPIVILAGLRKLGPGGLLGAVAFTGVTVNRMLYRLAAEVSTPPAWSRQRVQAPRQGEATYSARCAACGGDASFPGGATETICPWCAATLVAPDMVKEQELATAADRVAEARVLSKQEQHEAFAVYTTMVGPGTAMAVLGGLGATVLIGLGAMLPTREASTPMFLLATLPVAIIVAVALVFRQRR